jgi:hypothetical protein
VANPDPKPGRWILPVLIAALVGLTYAFVTNVPQSPATTSTTLGSATPATPAPTSTTSAPGDTTTTTLDPEVEAFIEVSDGLATSASDLSDEAAAINASWEAEETEYGPTRDALRDLASRTRQFATAAGIATLPSTVEDLWTDVTAAADLMATAADDMLDGLVNSAGPEKRQASLVTYQEAVDDLTAAIDEAQAAASG